ncbi:MAG: LptA/OstA family protein [Verrucomicrobiota bacterium]
MGKTGQKTAEGVFRLTGVRAETYTYKDKVRSTNFVVQAADCIWDQNNKRASSAGAVEAQTSDGRLKISGTGFDWQQSNTTLFLSNNVHTVIAPELIKKGIFGGKAEKPLEVTSTAFELSRERGLAVYRGNVRGSDGRMTLQCGELYLTNSATSDTDIQIESAYARQEVVFEEAGGLRAGGDEAVYRGTGGKDVITVTGHTHWRSKDYEGASNLLVYDRQAGEFSSTGNALMKIAAKSFSKTKSPNRGGLLGPSDQPVEVRAEQISAKMQADGSTPQTVVADRNVVISQGETRATGQQAILANTPGTEKVELTGSPAWKTDRMEGRGQTIVFDRATERFSVNGDAYFHLLPQTKDPANRPDPSTVLGAGDIEANADRYSYQPGTLTFDGQVRVKDRLWNLNAETIAMKLSPEGNRVTQVDARRNVTAEPHAAKGVTQSPWTMSAGEARAIFSPDGHWLMAVKARDSVRVQQLGPGKSPAWQLEAATAEVRMVPAFNRLSRIEANENVRVRQLAQPGSNVPPWQLTSDTVSAQFIPSGERLSELDATGKVFVEQLNDPKGQPNAPLWKLDSASVKVKFADDNQINTIAAKDKVFVRQVPSTGSTDAGLWNLRSYLLDLKLAAGGKQIETVHARENVQVRQNEIPGQKNSGWELSAKEATVGLAPDGRQIASVNASRDIRIQSGLNYATGDQLRFTGDTGKAELTGTPLLYLNTPPEKRQENVPDKVVLTGATKLLWDRAQGTFKALGPWRMSPPPK